MPKNSRDNVARFAAEMSQSELSEQLVGKPRRRDRTRRNHHKGTITNKPFVSWDGEAAGNGETAQDYCLIGNSNGGILRNDLGALHTRDILEFMLGEAERLGEVINVAFGFNYDVNHIIRNIGFNRLKRLHKKNSVWYGKYRLEWFPNKWFSISHRETKRFILIYDTIGFWGTSLINAIRQDPKLRSDPRLSRIESGKSERGTFRLSELDSKVIPYFQAEMELHRQLMENMRMALAAVDLVPRKWYGPSAVISEVYTRTGLIKHMNRPEGDLTRERKERYGKLQTPDKRYEYTLPDDVNRVARASFAGGRFEQFKIGYYEGTVYGYDITSAYPFAMLSLPSLSNGVWHYIDSNGLREWHRSGKPELPWGFYRLVYSPLNPLAEKDEVLSIPAFPHPLFRRDEFGKISYPFKCEGWYPTHSANALWKSRSGKRYTLFVEGWWFEPGNDVRPFESDNLNFRTMFNKRAEYKKAGREDLAYALKIALNSGYGKTAQRQGVELGDNLPAFHQIEWASHITDHCRIQIWKAAVESWRSSGLISIETDAIYSTTAVDFTKLGFPAEGLGGIKEEIYDGICYLQSGVYFTKKGNDWTFHMRGLDRESISLLDAREHFNSISDTTEFWPSIFGSTHRFNGIGYSRVSDTSPNKFYDKWLKWQTDDKEIKLGLPGLKRVHMAEYCEACKEGISPANGLHTLASPKGHAGLSYPRNDAWIKEDIGVIWQDKDEERWN